MMGGAGAFLSLTALLASMTGGAQAQGSATSGSTPKKAPGNVVRYEGGSGDWSYRCVFTDGNTAKAPQICAIEQALMMDKGKDASPERLGGVFIARIPPKPGAASNTVWRLTLMTPLGTSLEKPVTLGLDNGSALTLPWQACVADGCLSTINLTTAQLTSLRKAGKAEINLKKVVPGVLKINFSLAGLDQAFNAVDKWGRGNR